MIFLSTFDTLQLALVIPKMLQCIVWVILAILILRKSNYILNKVFFVVFMGGALFALADAIIYAIAPNGEDWLLRANIGRDISIFGFIIMSVGFYFAAVIIKKSYTSISTKEKAILAIFATSLFILLIIFDRIAVFDLNTHEEIIILPPTITEFKVTAVITPIVTVFYVIALSSLVLSLFILFQVYPKFEQKLEKKRIRYFIGGVAIELVSFLYFLILTSLKLRLLYLYWIGYIVAIFSPMFILIGMSIKAQGEKN